MEALFLSVILFFISGCTQNGEDSIYILPNDYSGYVVIFFNQPNGEPEKYLDGKRVYNIPPSGILKTKFSPEYRRTNLPEFYYKEVGKDNQLPVLVDWKDFKEGAVGASLPSIGKIYKKLDGTEAIEYENFFIGTKDQIEQYSEEFGGTDITSLIDQ